METDAHTEGPAKTAEVIIVVTILASVAWAIYKWYSALFYGPEKLLLFIADDAFYYLLVAKNLALHSLASFDGGRTITSGYHPLWCWMLTLLFDSPTNSEDIMIFMAALSVCLSLISMLALLYLSRKLKDFPLAFAAPIVFTSYSFSSNSLASMEWPLVVVLDLVLWISLLRVKSASCLSLLGFLLLGILSSLARTDFGLEAFILVVTGYLVCGLKKESKYLTHSLFLLFGACIGLAGALCYFYYTSGQWLQGSAMVKSLWGKSAGFRFESAAFQFLRVFFYLDQFSHEANLFVHNNVTLISSLLFVITCTVLVTLRHFFCSFFHMAKQILNEGSTEHSFLVASSAFITGAYFLLYSLNGVELHVWYTAHVVWPLIFLLAFCFKALLKASKSSFYFLLATAVSLVTLANIFLSASSAPPFYYQGFFRKMGEIAGTTLKGQTIGMSGAGAAAFYQGGTLINLDGLVNNEIYRFMPNRLHCYLLAKRIAYFDGFGASEWFFKLPPKESYSTPIDFGIFDNLPLRFYATDFSKLMALEECKDSESLLRQPK